MTWNKIKVYFSSGRVGRHFKVYVNNMKIFKDQYYLVTSLTEVSRVSIYEVQSVTPLRRADKFPKF